ncbi:MAG: hypothetical protein HY975_02735 [Candidatus Kerfeldbacteria bacterium]|nr:hypothetical protein [Candidatus Kerfeldbacteria bacterium]
MGKNIAIGVLVVCLLMSIGVVNYQETRANRAESQVTTLQQQNATLTLQLITARREVASAKASILVLQLAANISQRRIQEGRTFGAFSVGDEQTKLNPAVGVSVSSLYDDRKGIVELWVSDNTTNEIIAKTTCTFPPTPHR